MGHPEGISKEHQELARISPAAPPEPSQWEMQRIHEELVEPTSVGGASYEITHPETYPLDK